ncbi:MAG: organic solvent tolerance ABC transporter substrate-binding protein [Candidatus Rokuibacteriota bacterium]|nr:MAG: organic solvent tolerance ABC transporter substrate-binding protein [Candidatus Rokubacteria bacterium]
MRRDRGAAGERRTRGTGEAAMTGRAMAVGIVVALVVMVAEREAWAGAPTEQLRTQIDRAIKVLEDPEMAKESRMVERRTAIRRIANEIFDFTETTRRSLGTHWQVRTPQERDEVTRLFADLLERSYIGRIETYSGERIQFLGDTIDGDQTTVRSRLITKQGMEIPVDYRMHRASGDRWLTYDVAIEGVSLVANYRAQFNKIIQTSGYTSLVKKLAAKEQEGMQADRELTVKKASQTR